MKNVIYLIITLLIVGCDIIKNEEMRFSLDVKDERIDKLLFKKVTDNDQITIDTLYKDQWINGRKFTLKKPGEYILKIDKKNGVPFCIRPGFDLKITMTKKNRFRFEGKGKDENEYYVSNINHPLDRKNFTAFKLPPEFFLKELEKTLSPFTELIANKHKRNIFWKQAYVNHNLRKFTALMQYPFKYQELTSQEAKLPENYWDFTNTDDFNKIDLHKGEIELQLQFYLAKTELEKKGIIKEGLSDY